MDSSPADAADGPGRAADLGSLTDRLIGILERHARLHRQLLSLMERKKRAMVGDRLDELEEILGEERDAVGTIGESERERIALMDAIGSLLGFAPPRRLRLLDLISRVGEEHREVLLDLRDELRDIADDMDRINRLNRTLVLHSLEHVHLFLALLRGKDPAAKTYSKEGGAEEPSGSILLDRRI